MEDRDSPGDLRVMAASRFFPDQQEPCPFFSGGAASERGEFARHRADGAWRKNDASRGEDRRAHPRAGEFLRDGRLYVLGLPPAQHGGEVIWRRGANAGLWYNSNRSKVRQFNIVSDEARKAVKESSAHESLRDVTVVGVGVSLSF